MGFGDVPGSAGQGRPPRGTAASQRGRAQPHTALPQFSMEVEEQAAGVDVGKVFVHDKDLAGSPSWLAKFTILEGDPEGNFAIRTDPHTNDGVLSVVKVGRGRPGDPRGSQGPADPQPLLQPLDHELRDRFELTVSVQNEQPLEPSAPGSPRALATVRVRVRDVNEAPVFRENPRRISVLEGTPPGTPITTYTASDPDTHQIQTLRWVLLPSHRSQHPQGGFGVMSHPAPRPQLRSALRPRGLAAAGPSLGHRPHQAGAAAPVCLPAGRLVHRTAARPRRW